MMFVATYSPDLFVLVLLFYSGPFQLCFLFNTDNFYFRLTSLTLYYHIVTCQQ